ncbi:hypothetical protein [Candidatus Thioglobus sp.]|uniref:hypothetical protein n=1 Tax=Candidatus Thioglobus sp. TaxID=2026721 RepID=UPI003D1311AE
MKQKFICILLILFSVTAKANLFVERIVEDDFSNVKEEITLAIEGQGLVIAHHSDVAIMLNRTAKDLAQQAFSTMTNILPIKLTKNQPTQGTYQHGVVIEFCSASLSAETTAADVNNILLCPFSVAIYQLNGEPNQVHVSYLRLSKFADEDNLKSVIALTQVEDMLAEIVAEALD